MCKVCDMRLAIEAVVTENTGIFDTKQTHVDLRAIREATTSVLQVGARLVAMDPDAIEGSELFKAILRAFREEVSTVRKMIESGDPAAVRPMH